MDTQIIIAVAALVTAVGSIVSAVLMYRKTVALLDYRMVQVEKKLNEHNGYAEKFAKVSDSLSELHTDIAVIKNDLSYLKER